MQHIQGVYPTLCFAYFAQAVCQDSALWIFEQYLEAREVEDFAGETRSKSIGKARKEAISTQMFVLLNEQFASDSGFRPAWSACLVSWR